MGGGGRWLLWGYIEAKIPINTKYCHFFSSQVETEDQLQLAEAVYEQSTLKILDCIKFLIFFELCCSRSLQFNS